MNERHQDFELLYRFTRDGQQSAFADVVRRHFDLVFATALRKLEDSNAAQEVTQNVFSALARKAWRFAPDDSLPAWLHKAALLESKSWLRGELGRRRREKTAAEMGTTMKIPEDQTAFNALVPLLDDALLSLREKDRTALLLRFYERQSLREVGMAFGVSEDTAQKRVQTALEKVADYFKRRGFRTATTAGAVAALQHTAASASAAIVSSVVGVALQAAPPALTGFGAWLARLASLSRVQTAVVCVVLAAAPVGWQLKERSNANDEARRSQVQLFAAQNEHAALQTELDRLRLESGRLEQSVAQADAAAARGVESAQVFETWKRNALSQIFSADYRWDDRLEFVRIPKAVLPEISNSSRVNGPPADGPFKSGIVADYFCQLLCLSPQERQAMEDTLQRVAELQRGKPADVYEADLPPVSRQVAAREFTEQPTSATGEVGDEAKKRIGEMLATLRSILGEERWQIIPEKYRIVNCQLWNRALITESPPLWVRASVEQDDSGALTAVWTMNGNIASNPVPKETGSNDNGAVYSQNAVDYANSGSVSEPAPKNGDGGGGVTYSQPVGYSQSGSGNPNGVSGTVFSQNIVGYVNPRKNPQLSAFLADADADAIKPSASSIPLPEAIRRRMAEWFHEQAVLRLGGKERP